MGWVLCQFEHVAAPALEESAGQWPSQSVRARKAAAKVWRSLNGLERVVLQRAVFHHQPGASLQSQQCLWYQDRRVQRMAPGRLGGAGAVG